MTKSSIDMGMVHRATDDDKLQANLTLIHDALALAFVKLPPEAREQLDHLFAESNSGLSEEAQHVYRLMLATLTGLIDAQRP
ncbi:MAG: hypothetical protein OXQ29_03020 [Rhodospirillaceae bacterium]|nr:hypothetical protein [Rhodospirillaceae bacterium]